MGAIAFSLVMDILWFIFYTKHWVSNETEDVTEESFMRMMVLIFSFILIVYKVPVAISIYLLKSH